MIRTNIFWLEWKNTVTEHCDLKKTYTDDCDTVPCQCHPFLDHTGKFILNGSSVWVLIHIKFSKRLIHEVLIVQLKISRNEELSRRNFPVSWIRSHELQIFCYMVHLGKYALHEDNMNVVKKKEYFKN